mmetsp:Transcript_15237/g.49639  ORF Transcript_15237/g.49639 Transcript_15237/m.49639 type:complete len:315 (+) Transcript_15237:45-989(+)
MFTSSLLLSRRKGKGGRKEGKDGGGHKLTGGRWRSQGGAGSHEVTCSSSYVCISFFLSFFQKIRQDDGREGIAVVCFQRRPVPVPPVHQSTRARGGGRRGGGVVVPSLMYIFGRQRASRSTCLFLGEGGFFLEKVGQQAVELGGGVGGGYLVAVVVFAAGAVLVAVDLVLELAGRVEGGDRPGALALEVEGAEGDLGVAHVAPVFACRKKLSEYEQKDNYFTKTNATIFFGENSKTTLLFAPGVADDPVLLAVLGAPADDRDDVVHEASAVVGDAGGVMQNGLGVDAARDGSAFVDFLLHGVGPGDGAVVGDGD